MSVWESDNSADYSPFASCYLLEGFLGEGSVDGRSVVDDGSDEGFVGVIEGFRMASVDASSGVVEEVSAVSCFFEGLLDVRIEGAVVGEGGSKVADCFLFGDW
jgi:hypothetical protein